MRSVTLKSGRIVEVRDDSREFAAGTVCTEEEDRTRQSDADAADINRIVDRMVAGQLPRPVLPADLDALYLDLSDIPDYRTAFAQVDLAREHFGRLTAEQRLVFENDPVRLLDAIDRQDRTLLERAKLVDPIVVPPVTPPVIP